VTHENLRCAISKGEFWGASRGGDVWLVLWHALPRSEYSVEIRERMAGGANGLVGRDKKFFVGCEWWEGGVGAGSALWRGLPGFPDIANFRGVKSGRGSSVRRRLLALARSCGFRGRRFPGVISRNGTSGLRGFTSANRAFPSQVLANLQHSHRELFVWELPSSSPTFPVVELDSLLRSIEEHAAGG
jgi:hypothetical protein